MQEGTTATNAPESAQSVITIQQVDPTYEILEELQHHITMLNVIVLGAGGKVDWSKVTTDDRYDSGGLAYIHQALQELKNHALAFGGNGSVCTTANRIIEEALQVRLKRIFRKLPHGIY